MIRPNEAPADGVALTVDVEEWFHAPEHPLGLRESSWDALPATLPDAVDRTLTLLEEMGVRATFFILGWAARRYPSLVARIAGGDHEVACHGWGHGLVAPMPPEEFRRDLREARTAIESAAGAPLRGYRSPKWSMPRESWPYRLLREEGFSYSSSRLPIPGLGGGPAFPRTVEGVVELPALALPPPLSFLPAGGTLALRLLPMRLLSWTQQRARAFRRPAVYWFHPWELYPDAPRLEGNALFRFARYGALDRLPERLRALVPPGDRRLASLVPAYSISGQEPR